MVSGDDETRTTRHSSVPLCRQFLQLFVEKTSGACGYRVVRIRVVEADEEEGHIVLPGNAPEAAEIGHGDDVPVAVLLVADLELIYIRGVVHVPAEDDGAEAKATRGNGEKLLLGHELASELAVDVYTGEFDGIVIFQELGQALDRDLVWYRGHAVYRGLECVSERVEVGLVGRGGGS